MTDEAAEVVTEESLTLKLREVEAALVIVKGEISPIKEKRDYTREQVKFLQNAQTLESSELTKAFYEARAALDRKHRDEMDELNAKYAESLESLKQEVDELSTSMYDAEVKVRHLERDRDSLQRQLDQLRRARLKAEDFANLNDAWEKATMGAPWREWAKDHQMDAAKKIAYSGRMILADTMGLGKTLSAIMALDMIKNRTVGATPDEPIIID